MNKIYQTQKSQTPLTQEELFQWESKLLSELFPDFVNRQSTYDMSRIEGTHCECNGQGEFVLSNIESEEVQEGGKAYMTCRICGCSSHL